MLKGIYRISSIFRELYINSYGNLCTVDGKPIGHVIQGSDNKTQVHLVSPNVLFTLLYLRDFETLDAVCSLKLQSRSSSSLSDNCCRYDCNKCHYRLQPTLLGNKTDNKSYTSLQHTVRVIGANSVPLAIKVGFFDIALKHIFLFNTTLLGLFSVSFIDIDTC